MKVLTISDSGYMWHVPLSAIAKHRAEYYARVDKDTTFAAEFDFVMEDDFEGVDWYENNMDFINIKDQARLVQTPEVMDEPTSDAEVDIEDVPEVSP